MNEENQSIKKIQTRLNSLIELLKNLELMFLNINKSEEKVSEEKAKEFLVNAEKISDSILIKYEGLDDFISLLEDGFDFSQKELLKTYSKIELFQYVFLEFKKTYNNTLSQITDKDFVKQIKQVQSLDELQKLEKGVNKIVKETLNIFELEADMGYFEEEVNKKETLSDNIVSWFGGIGLIVLLAIIGLIIWKPEYLGNIIDISIDNSSFWPYAISILGFFLYMVIVGFISKVVEVIVQKILIIIIIILLILIGFLGIKHFSLYEDYRDCQDNQAGLKKQTILLQNNFVSNDFLNENNNIQERWGVKDTSTIIRYRNSDTLTIILKVQNPEPENESDIPATNTDL